MVVDLHQAPSAVYRRGLTVPFPSPHSISERFSKASLPCPLWGQGKVSPFDDADTPTFITLMIHLLGHGMSVGKGLESLVLCSVSFGLHQIYYSDNILS